MKRIRIWDIPTRIFHWLLVCLIAISFYTGLSGGFVEMDYHMLSGYGILTLVLFRILWGIVGSHYSRFQTFIKGPREIARYIKNINRETAPFPGHNPLGALSIMAILLMLLVQGTTGLFANDDIMLEGPLTHLVSYDTSRKLTSIHKSNIWIIGALIGLHLCAIGFYQFIKKERLLGAMFTGHKLLTQGQTDTGSPARELLLGTALIGICSGVVYSVVNYL